MIRYVFLFSFAFSGLFSGLSLAAAPSPAAETFRDCSDCPEMIVVPAGTFKMGSPPGVMNENEGPQHPVTIRKPFAVGIHAVTFDQWEACVAAGGCNGYSPPSEGWGKGNRPVIAVNWHDAKAYVRWLNDMLRSLEAPEAGADADANTDAAAKAAKPGPYRLLSEAEWEYAARAGTTTAYYWGESRSKGRANCDGCGSEWDNTQTAPVGSFAPNAFGLYDMAGNVLQWTEDCYHETYANAPGDGSPWMGRICDTRMMRGGSWFNSTYYIRVTQRFIVSAHIRANNAGFRVAKTLEE